MPFRKKIRIYFDQGDPANIAFHGQHTIIAQRVMEDYIQDLGIPWEDWYRNKDLFIPVVHYDIQFKKPLIPGNEYFVEVQIEAVGISSVSVNYKILSLKEEDCCLISATYVCVSSKEFKSQPLPEKWKSLLENALEK